MQVRRGKNRAFDRSSARPHEGRARLFHHLTIYIFEFGKEMRERTAQRREAAVPVPLGYRCVEKKLEIVLEEAGAVRTIFTLYLELGSMGRPEPRIVSHLKRESVEKETDMRNSRYRHRQGPQMD
jgi:hypothetical protein